MELRSSVVAVDIGGANLKAADGRGYAASVPFALWRTPQDLPAALGKLLDAAPPSTSVVATMTGELADCFPTKADGVRAIVFAIVAAAGQRSVRVYLTDGRLATPTEAIEQPVLAAASNWHALARFSARFLPGGEGLLIDIGSTTCDLIPIIAGQPAAVGRTDPERLVSGELVYTGVTRSPVCAVVAELPWRGAGCPVAQELFATTYDAWLLLGELPEEPDSLATADGRPATREFARDRLARMVCADREAFSEANALIAAQSIAEAQQRIMATSLRKVLAEMPTAPGTVIISGQGEFLARRVLKNVGFEGPIVSLGERLGPRVSQVAPAHALAVLALS